MTRLTALILSLVILGYSSYECDQLLMSSYKLTGLKTASEVTNPLCHTITRNCCSSDDVLKAFDLIKGSLEPNLFSFHDKMLKAFKEFGELNGEAQKITFKTELMESKKEHCHKAEKEFKEIKFGQLLDRLTVGFEKAFLGFQDYHYSFYCVLCDQEAHSKISTKSNVINLSSRNCISHVQNNMDYVRALNIELIDYLKKMQKFLDCAYYDNSFNFKFLYENQGDFENTTKICLEKLSPDSTELIPECKDFCGQLNIAGISPHLEGDPLFMDEAIDYFTNLIEAIHTKHKENDLGFNPMQKLQELDENDPENIALFQDGHGKAARMLRKELLEERRIKKARRLEKELLEDRRLLEEKPAEIDDNPNAARIKEELEYYNAIKFDFHEKSDEVMRCQVDPVELSTFSMTFSYDAELDLFKYFEGLNMEMNRDELLALNKTLEADSLDRFVETLLAACDPSIKEESEKDLGGSFVFIVDPNSIDPFESELLNATEGNYDPEEMFDRGPALKEIEEEGAAVEADKQAVEENKEEAKAEEENRLLRQKKGKRTAKRRKKRQRRRYRRRKHHRRYRRYRMLEELTGVKRKKRKVNI